MLYLLVLSQFPSFNPDIQATKERRANFIWLKCPNILPEQCHQADRGTEPICRGSFKREKSSDWQKSDRLIRWWSIASDPRFFKAERRTNQYIVSKKNKPKNKLGAELLRLPKTALLCNGNQGYFWKRIKRKF